MNIRQLKYFLGVLKERSITKAAARLYVAQPALGLQLRKLEEELNVELFVRHSRGVAPTDAGIRLASHAEILIRQFERTKQDMLDYAGEPHGRLSIGFPASATFVICGLLSKRCLERYPKIILNISTGLSETLMEWVQDDKLDMTLTYNPDLVPGLVSIPLAAEKLAVVQHSSDGPLSESDSHLEHILEKDLILPSAPHLLRTLVNNVSRDLGLEPKVKLEVDSVAAIKEILRRNLGITILPYAAVHLEVESGELVAAPITEPSIERKLYLAYSPGHPLSKAFTVVSELIKELVDEVINQRDIGWTAPTAKAKQQGSAAQAELPNVAKIAGESDD